MHIAMHSRKSVLGRRLFFLTAQDKRCYAPDTTRDTEAIAETEGQLHRPTHKDIKRGQTVLYAHLLAQHIELMVTTRLTLTAGKEAVSELLAVVGQQLGDLDRTGLVQGLQECLGAWPYCCK